MDSRVLSELCLFFFFFFFVIKWENFKIVPMLYQIGLQGAKEKSRKNFYVFNVSQIKNVLYML